MSRKLFLFGLFIGLSVTSLALSQQPAPAADDKKTIEIVKNAGGKFVFSEPNVEIKPGQSITWMAVDAEVPHQLVPAGEDDAFTDTGTFDATDPPTQSFDTPGTINYICSIHPSMKGTITVADTEEAPAEEPAKPAKRKPKPSYDSGY